ncbi:methyl-accepting chemotaxis protein [Sphingomonas floccifaciens]|uniref:Methyl-accepting chemotaxis protein n=2 Tax=Sphingomonas floccifaciens TaxID=1844115 RepID=A0ABW4N7G1_9SPHN
MAEGHDRASLRSYRRHFLYPLCAIMGAAGVIILALLIWLTVKSDAQEAKREAELANLVVTGRLDFMRRNQSDYATWDDSVANLVIALDPEWASDNIGPYLFRTQGYEHSFVIDGRNRAIYASDRLSQARIDPFAMMGPALTKAVAELRRKPVGEDHRRGGLVRIGDQLAAFSIAAIVPDPGKVSLPSGPASYLLFVDILTSEQLGALGAERGLTGLHFDAKATSTASAPGMSVLRNPHGRPLGHLAWSVQRPGTALRTMCLPPLALLLLAMALIGSRILRRCRLAIEQTDAAMRQSATDAQDARHALADLKAARSGAAAAEAAARERLEVIVRNVRRENDELNRRLAATRQAALSDAKQQLDAKLSPLLRAMQGQAQSLAGASEHVRDQGRGLGQLVDVATRAAEETERCMGKLTPEAAAFADTGREIEEEARAALVEVQRASDDGEQVQVSITALSASLDEIGRIVGGIDQLSRQTNLVALNARIEAARAGVAGEGFAVVANEVKALADHTAGLTRLVADQLDTLMRRTADTSNAARTVASALSRTELATGVITTVVQQQVQGASTIRQSIDAVAAESRNTAAAVADARSAIAVGLDAADRMDAVAMDLATMLGTLNDDIAIFLRQMEAA